MLCCGSEHDASEKKLLALSQDVSARDLSAGAALAAVSGKTVTYVAENPALADAPTGPPAGAVFTFSEVDVTVSDAGYVTSYGARAGSQRLHRFKRLGTADSYGRAMSLMTGKMLARLWPASGG
jgi:hypothetical protein